MHQSIQKEFAQAGLRVGVIAASHLQELQSELDTLRQDGFLGTGVQRSIDRFKLNEALVRTEQTVLILATPAAIGQAVFHLNGTRLTTLIPPTYIEMGSVPAMMEKRMNQILQKYNYHAKHERCLPAKMLAAYGGLAEYGRNNVCYVEGLGSFALLTTYLTDMPCTQDDWQKPRRMDSCISCTACTGNCPTGAIQKGRSVIDGERCLTMHNEAPSSVPFPSWISPSAHHCLVGCMRCQTACPINRDALSFLAPPVAFDERETALLINGEAADTLPASTRNKMAQINMDLYYDALARNLQALSMASACTCPDPFRGVAE